jgi:hypothetical protein
MEKSPRLVHPSPVDAAPSGTATAGVAARKVQGDGGGVRLGVDPHVGFDLAARAW